MNKKANTSTSACELLSMPSHIIKQILQYPELKEMRSALLVNNDMRYRMPALTVLYKYTHSWSDNDDINDELNYRLLKADRITYALDMTVFEDIFCNNDVAALKAIFKTDISMLDVHDFDYYGWGHVIQSTDMANAVLSSEQINKFLRQNASYIY